MNNKTPYTAPKAELICLVPRESIAWSTINDNKWWKNPNFFWGAAPTEENSSMVTWYQSIDLTDDPSTKYD